METRSRSSQPAQPPKQAAYAQSSNPVLHRPGEQRDETAPIRHRGDPPMVKRSAHSKPSSDEARARLDERHRLEQKSMQDAPNVDLEYGVEQQPSEGYIADAVERKGMGIHGAQAGAHAGSVGSAHGPGHPGFGQERDFAADMNRKMDEHERFLGDEIGQSPSEPEHDVAEREAVRRNKLRQDEELNVEGAVKDATGNSVVANK